MPEWLLKKIEKDKKELSASYEVPISAVVWIGDNRYIVVKDGKQILD